MRRAGYLLSAALTACLTLGAIALFLSGPLMTRAVQNPKISLDMDPASNSYDAATNTMTVGTVDGCLASPQANSSTHVHTAQIVIENVEDLIGWQARLNYNGDEMRPANVDFDPFVDTTTGQEVSFVNLPKDSATGKHREITPGLSIPPPGPGPQSALVGAAYSRTQTFEVSPDTPPKSPPDDSSYSAPNGGVLAAVNLEVPGDQSGRTLFMQVDDGNPNPPGSSVVFFTGSGLQDSICLPETALSSGFHAEGAQTCSAVSMPRNLVADLGFENVVLNAPASVQAWQYFDIQLTATVVNQGPDETYVSFSLVFGVPEDCFGLAEHLTLVSKMEPLSTASLEDSERFFCQGPPGGTQAKPFNVNIYPRQNAIDPEPSNNVGSGEAVVNVLGTGTAPSPTPDPLPTATPVDGSPPDPIQVPDSPGPTAPADNAVIGTSPSSGTSPSGNPAVAQPIIETPAQAVLAAALPQTGERAGQGEPTWLLVGVAGGVLGITGATAVAMRRLMARRG